MSTGARAISSVRLLAYASEAGVSTVDVIPRKAYLATWALSGAYVVADVFVKVQAAPVRGSYTRLHDAIVGNGGVGIGGQLPA